jgi:hypothetical protein
MVTRSACRLAMFAAVAPFPFAVRPLAYRLAFAVRCGVLSTGCESYEPCISTSGTDTDRR